METSESIEPTTRVELVTYGLRNRHTDKNASDSNILKTLKGHDQGHYPPEVVARAKTVLVAVSNGDPIAYELMIHLCEQIIASGEATKADVAAAG